MKKTLLLLSVIVFGICGHAQVIVDENLDALVIGNVGTDLTGTPGQGGWQTIVANGGSNTDFQVVNYGGEYGNVFQITGNNTNTASTNRRLVKDIAGDWGFREPGNNIAEVQFDFFTGPATTTANNMRVILYDATLTKMLGGIMIYMSTLELRGLSYYDNTAASGGILGNYSFRLGYTAVPTPAYSDIILERNTWYKLGFSFNFTTGEVIFKKAGPGPSITSPPIIGASAGTEASILNVAMNTVSLAADQPNTVSGVGLYDNIVFRASATNSPLAVVSNTKIEQALSVYPNPTKDILNVSNGKKIMSGIAITDLTGKTVQQHLTSADTLQLDVSDLSAGVYILKIQSAEGESIKKFIKE